jgi:transketolase
MLTLMQVISMPCWELLDEQSQEYKQSLFPEGVPVMSIEASVTQGWPNLSQDQFGITGYGKGPYPRATLSFF